MLWVKKKKKKKKQVPKGHPTNSNQLSRCILHKSQSGHKLEGFFLCIAGCSEKYPLLKQRPHPRTEKKQKQFSCLKRGGRKKRECAKRMTVVKTISSFPILARQLFRPSVLEKAPVCERRVNSTPPLNRVCLTWRGKYINPKVDMRQRVGSQKKKKKKKKRKKGIFWMRTSMSVDWKSATHNLTRFFSERSI